MLRYGQASPWDLLRAIRASPGLKLNSPGRRTCQMDRPDQWHHITRYAEKVTVLTPSRYEHSCDFGHMSPGTCPNLEHEHI